METLSVDEYQRLRQRAVEKKDRFVPLFMASKTQINHVLNSRRLFRLYMGTTIMADFITLTTPIAWKFKMIWGSASILYGMVGLTNLITVGLFFALNGAV